MTSPTLERPDRDPPFLEFACWRGSSHSDDEQIIRRNMTRMFMDPKGFNKPFLGFRLARYKGV